MRAAVTLLSGILIGLVSLPAIAETAPPQNDTAALLERVEALERKVAKLEKDCGAVRTQSPSNIEQSAPPGDGHAGHRVLVGLLVNGGGEDHLAIGPMCKAALDGELAAHGYVSVNDAATADREIDVTITYTWLTAVWGHGSVGDVRFEYFATVKRAADGATLTTLSNDHSGGASTVCRRFATGVVEKAAHALASEPRRLHTSRRGRLGGRQEDGYHAAPFQRRAVARRSDL